MLLKNQVCTMDQAKRLKSLGVNQQSLFYWHPLYHLPVASWEILPDFTPVNEDHKNSSSAFSVAELCQMLPDMLTTHLQYELVCIKESDCWLIRYVRNNDLTDRHPGVQNEAATTQAEAVANLLISLLEVGAVSVDDVNKRLTP